MADEHACPKCKGRKTHDTRLNRQNGTQTLYRCDDETCREQFWVDVPQAAPQGDTSPTEE